LVPDTNLSVSLPDEVALLSPTNLELLLRHTDSPELPKSALSAAMFDIFAKLLS